MKRTDFLKTLGVTAMGIGIGIPTSSHGITGSANEILGSANEISGSVNEISELTHGIPQLSGVDLPDLLVDAKGKSIRTVKKWNQQRALIKKRWLDYLGAPEPNPSEPVLKVLSEEKQKGIIRQYVEYEGEPGVLVRGYLLKPESLQTKTLQPETLQPETLQPETLQPETLQQKLPGVVALHSTSDNQMLCISGAEKGKYVQFGFELAQQGFVVFCPQCFLWHENEGRNWEEQSLHYIHQHPGTRGMGKMLFDAQRAVDVLESLDEVDSSRIGCMGHSLGAKEALYLGAFDDRVKTIVSNEGGIGIEMSNWDAVWYLGEEIGAFGHQHHEVLALAAPKSFLLIGGDSADGEHSRTYIEAVKPVYELYHRGQNLELKNHGLGHHAEPIAVEWTYDWIREHL